MSWLIFFAVFNSLTAFTCFSPGRSGFEKQLAGSKDPDKVLDRHSKSVMELNSSLRQSIRLNKFSESNIIIARILPALALDTDSLVLSESFYLIGAYNLLTGKNSDAVKYLQKAEVIREKIKALDDIYARTLYNLAVASNYNGDFRNMYIYSLRSLNVEEKLYGSTSPELIGSLSNLIFASIELQEYERSIAYGNRAIGIINNNENESNASELANLYYNIGVCHMRLSDYARAIPYLEKTESFYGRWRLRKDDRFINLLNSLAIAYDYLGFSDKSDDYYKRGVIIAGEYTSIIANNIINSYAIRLAKEGRTGEGEILLAKLLERGLNVYGPASRNYIEIIKNYAEYLRVYSKQYGRSLQYYSICIEYLNSHKEDLLLREPVLLGYSLALSATGRSSEALNIVQEMFYPETDARPGSNLENPPPESLKNDLRSLDLLRTKYSILWDIFEESDDPEYLLSAAGTAELIISVLERVRINLSEEESRLILGDRYRDSYLFAIRDFGLCYQITGRKTYLEKAFEYSERSKVAGLLAATRELRATQFHIPSAIADLERDLQREISLNNARILAENYKDTPDEYLLNEWNENLLKASHDRDSLISLFEKQYPEYYLIKYNTRVTELNDIPKAAGPRGNYLSYIVTDTMIYIFVVNRKHQEILSLSTGPEFFDNIKAYRALLLAPARSANAREQFGEFQRLGIYLYNILLEPVRKYLISDNLLISPDNILSYLPFETLIPEQYKGTEILYRELRYVMYDFRISYTYSLTFMSESQSKKFRPGNKLVAFAPVYPGKNHADSLTRNRQNDMRFLADIPFARQEAEYVAALTRGRLYINNGALESVFKSESGNYDIIHLAMHTVLNDRSPMHSTMVFYPEPDGQEDGFLNTWEVYGIPLRAKMVVLSSCNTGTGLLSSGEGVLSLARGFIYSGSQSVVMSLWEIEDRSGTEIIKNFYQNLRKGKSKTDALQKARIKYLKKASQIGSHPSFWAALVIYGNNSPLWYHKRVLISAAVILLLAAIPVYLYFRRSR
ncbi:MAG: CHAT domain-containing tetratricopeptide repeat protein [Bacteroidales bacterium]